jgi:hypothetical protein
MAPRPFGPDPASSHCCLQCRHPRSHAFLLGRGPGWGVIRVTDFGWRRTALRLGWAVERRLLPAVRSGDYESNAGCDSCLPDNHRGEEAGTADGRPQKIRGGELQDQPGGRSDQNNLCPVEKIAEGFVGDRNRHRNKEAPDKPCRQTGYCEPVGIEPNGGIWLRLVQGYSGRVGKKAMNGRRTILRQHPAKDAEHKQHPKLERTLDLQAAARRDQGDPKAQAGSSQTAEEIELGEKKV